jgi:hypothetical protein
LLGMWQKGYLPAENDVLGAEDGRFTGDFIASVLAF